MPRSRIRTVRALKPTIEGGRPFWELEPRVLLSRDNTRLVALQRKAAIVRAQAKRQDVFPSPKAFVQTGVANGGKAAAIVDTDGEVWIAHMTGAGTVRAKPAPDGRVDLFLYSTNNLSVLTIDPAGHDPVPGAAHDFPSGTEQQDKLVHVRNITVVSGKMNQILGYRTAEVSGVISVMGSAKKSPGPAVDRIAVFALNPGASIQVPGDLNTLNVFNNVTLTTGPGIRVGRDLNFFLIGGDLTLRNGTSIIVGRDIGLSPQGPKGSSPAGVGGLIQGDLIVGAGSTIAVGRAVDQPIIVQGSSSGIANLTANVQAQTIVYGTRG